MLCGFSCHENNIFFFIFQFIHFLRHKTSSEQQQKSNIKQQQQQQIYLYICVFFRSNKTMKLTLGQLKVTST